MPGSNRNLSVEARIANFIERYKPELVTWLGATCLTFTSLIQAFKDVSWIQPLVDLSLVLLVLGIVFSLAGAMLANKQKQHISTLNEEIEQLRSFVANSNPEDQLALVARDLNFRDTERITVYRCTGNPPNYDQFQIFSRYSQNNKYRKIGQLTRPIHEGFLALALTGVPTHVVELPDPHKQPDDYLSKCQDNYQIEMAPETVKALKMPSTSFFIYPVREPKITGNVVGAVVLESTKPRFILPKEHITSTLYKHTQNIYIWLSVLRGANAETARVAAPNLVAAPASAQPKPSLPSLPYQPNPIQMPGHPTSTSTSMSTPPPIPPPRVSPAQPAAIATPTPIYPTSSGKPIPAGYTHTPGPPGHLSSATTTPMISTASTTPVITTTAQSQNSDQLLAFLRSRSQDAFLVAGKVISEFDLRVEHLIESGFLIKGEPIYIFSQGKEHEATVVDADNVEYQGQQQSYQQWGQKMISEGNISIYQRLYVKRAGLRRYLHALREGLREAINSTPLPV